uniref:Uncharacterized protein n=1 Tax=Magallana gigas TaxID=29159 RepID=A0A8W8J6U3_MAGGI
MEIKISCDNGFMGNCDNLIKVGIPLVKKYAATSKPQTTTTKKPETTQRPGNAVTSTPQPRTTRASGNIGNADKDKRSSGTTLHISITGVETSQYTALLNALFLIPVWIIVKLNTDSA